MRAEALADHSQPDDEWPMPSQEVRRQLEPVPRWTLPPADDGERETD